MDLIGCEDYEGNYFVVKEASVDQLKGCFFLFFFFFFFFNFFFFFFFFVLQLMGCFFFFFFFFCKVVGSGTRGDHHAQGQIRRSNPAS
jgi:hypothetical protein